MADETITEPVTTTPPPEAGTPPPEPGKGSETVVEGKPGDGTTPPAEETFTKFDPKALKGESLAIFKKLQADYTRQRQSDVKRVGEIQRKHDEAMKELEHVRQFHAPKEPPKAEEPQIKPEDIADPVMRAMYEQNLALKSRLDNLESQGQERRKTEVETVTTGFYDKLTSEHKEIWQANLQAIHDTAVNLVKTGTKVEAALQTAMDAAVGRKLPELLKTTTEKVKRETLEGVKKKAEEVKPESGVNATTTVPQHITNAEEAAAAAIQMVRNKR